MAKTAKGKKALNREQKAKEAAPVAEAQAVTAEKPKRGLIGVNISLYTIAIILLMAAMFYFRAVPSHDIIFTNWTAGGSPYVNVAEDDGVYHMRLLENTLQHFPFRILYDPFTHFPYGSTVHFGPLFELIPAAFLLVIGLGHPSLQLIQTVGAYYPTVLGILVAIPVYYTGKKLFGRHAGLVAVATLALMTGAFFFRSMLGSLDHHIAEVLFMACTVACMAYALPACSKLGLEQIKNKDWASLKGPLAYGALAGVSLGCYLLTWPGALLLAFTLFIYFTAQAILDHFKGRTPGYLLILAAPVFLIPTIMVLPYSISNLSFQAVYYSLTQPVLFIVAFVGVCFEYWASRALQWADKWAFPAALAGSGIVGILALNLLFPSLFGIVQYSATQLWPSGGMTTILEAYPTFFSNITGKFTLDVVWSMFYWAFPAALLGLILLVARVFKTRGPVEVMFLTWNLVMAWALFAQNRYTYYYAVNIALLTAFLASEALRAIDADGLWAGFRKKVDSFESLQRFVKKNTAGCLAFLLVVLVFGFIAAYPVLPWSDVYGENKEGALFQAAASGGSPLPYEWYDTLTWMKNHTPDPQGQTTQPGFDFAGGQYYPPPRGGSGVYDYPASAYGVMSWWDYGHDIEYVAQRIPNANPFQAGITEQNSTTGASPFFCTTDEDTSVRMLDQLGSRYVVIDDPMATGKFNAIQKWINDTEGWDALTRSNLSHIDASGVVYEAGEKVPTIVDTDRWANSTMNRLYYEDATGMSHYRLVYDSAGAYALNFRFMQYDDSGQLIAGGIPEYPMRIDNYTEAMARYDVWNRFVVPQNDQGTLYVYGARPPAKYVKVFEKVKGATITGSAPDGASVTATLTLKTDWNRTFNYTASAVAHNGTYSFTVPYPTERMQGDGYSYGILPQTKYIISYDNTTRSVDVPESAVMDGASVQVT